MGALRTPREKWVEAGLAALAAGGVDAVRVETLATSLGVTKGGFYGYFADRDALLSAMLDTWEEETVDAVIRQSADATENALDQVRVAGRLTFSERLLPIDLAVRDWARRDDTVAARLRRVDNARMQLLREAIGLVCDDPEEIEARAFLAFSAAISSSLLAADHPGMTRAQVARRAGDLLFTER